ncbi:nucleotidyltransferase [Candidatus Saganbacteria bacterium CG08_land_8_20_14_0_20_45_16]|uniref:Nucleotidyltransferase n=1 Tax=Candidatus Saganbacteria bacterium CG08_land_8_20_14_0_20_45_16 TaxID=2014293 RepID=A0A2H0XYG4_UNCSA|nr:MAG: nucleotidyltransferase [Candidatus Saganbacteria bacterium CG08_land_8_20_14_0_20_45_16]
MASDTAIKNIFNQFNEAFKRLKEAIADETTSELKRDAVIKRFEFTYELLWKMLKRIATKEKLEAFSPKSSFQAAFQLGLIENEGLFIDIIDARNKTSHVYSEMTADEIYSFICDHVIVAFDKVNEKIKGKYELS